MSDPPSRPSDGGLSLSPGDRLGPYEIVRPIGAGGMGEVYRARDSRLRRDVALKVLHRSLSITPEHVSRLAREARAAGSLNHPNIVAVFDVGTEGPVPYVVSELLEGESLRSRLLRGPLPCRKALDFGIQIARALGAAHEKGIWHRDVKPGNIFVTSDGRAKLLDFGLVKLRPDGIGSEDSTADATQPGGVHGTIGYMSPEQVLGEDVDHRSDLFALGCVLYEMLSGVPAFRRASAIETTKAVLNEEPPALDGSKPAAASAVVRRCLEKNKEERYQSARDLAFHLQLLQDATAVGSADPVSLPARRRRLALALLALALGGAAAVLVARALQRPVPAFEQITFRRGRISGARFASDGGNVVYSEAREGRSLVWLREPDRPESGLLGHEGADVLSARAGNLALSLRSRFVFGERFVGTAAQVPIAAGTPLEMTENVEDADWDPAGKQLVVARSVSIQGETRLEYPPGRALYKTAGSIRHPRFSRDGRRIAFVEDPSGRGAGGRVAMVDLDGRLTPLTENWGSARGLAWSAQGDEIWFAAGETRTSRTLRSVDMRGRHRVVLEAPASLTLWDIGADGRVLLARDEERSSLVGVPPGETHERDLSWFDSSGLADLSADGSKVLFDDRFGVYVRDTSGLPPVDLGLRNGQGDQFSPDGTRVLATTDSGRRLVIVSLRGGGNPIPLPQHGIDSYRGALWLPDGLHVLFNGTRPGVNLLTYVQDLKGGAPRDLTLEDTWVLAVSQDGKWAAAVGPEGISLVPLAGGEKRIVPSSRPDDRPVAWTADGRSLWIFRRGAVPAEVSQLDIETGRRRHWKNLQPPDPSGVYSINQFRVTSDGRSYFYSYKRVLSQLYAVSGLE